MIWLFINGWGNRNKSQGRFIEPQEVLDPIKKYKHLSAQQMVKHVFKYFEQLQDFKLRDDFTLIILKKEV